MSSTSSEFYRGAQQGGWCSSQVRKEWLESGDRGGNGKKGLRNKTRLTWLIGGSMKATFLNHLAVIESGLSMLDVLWR